MNSGAAGWLAVIGLGVAGLAAAAPAPGRYRGELCVGLGAAPPSCGPAQLEVQAQGLATARVDDIVYRLKVRAGREVAVLLTQGAGQLDQFVADGGWVGNALRFADGEKNVRYELRFGARVTR